MFLAIPGQVVQRLFRRCRKRRQCVDVARIVPNDDGRLVIRDAAAKQLAVFSARPRFLVSIARRGGPPPPDEAHQAIGRPRRSG